MSRAVDLGGSRLEAWFERTANAIAKAMGRPLTFVICTLLVLVWAASGPFFHFSDTWQLVINTGTTIVTFLMVFLIQNSQNREGQALHAKLDELLRAVQDAQDSFIGLENRSEKEIAAMRNDSEDDPRPADDQSLHVAGARSNAALLR